MAILKISARATRHTPIKRSQIYRPKGGLSNAQSISKAKATPAINPGMIPTITDNILFSFFC